MDWGLLNKVLTSDLVIITEATMNSYKSFINGKRHSYIFKKELVNY